jgi:hypothetical protein
MRWKGRLNEIGPYGSTQKAFEGELAQDYKSSAEIGDNGEQHNP